MDITDIASRILLATLFSFAAGVAAEPGARSTWITLGTVAGPLPAAERSQPANALIVDSRVYLVDAGDGVSEQLAKVGINIHAVKAVFLSHLHFDHTGGLPALLALRWQTTAPEPLIVYGPPGTQRMVEGIFAFMGPGVEGGYGLPGRPSLPASNNISVVEIASGSTLELDDFGLRTVRNTHYSWPEGTPEWNRFQSLAFRFDLADRSIVYTGDTGPSDAVVELAKDADLYVSEMMEVDKVVAVVKRVNPTMPERVFKGMKTHLSLHHVTPEDVGKMAAAAKVKRVVVTHLGPGVTDAAVLTEWQQRVADIYRGQVVIANDLDQF